MPGPIDTQDSFARNRAARLSIRWLIAAALFPALRVSANCPEPDPLDSDANDAAVFAPVDPNAPLEISSDSLEATREGEMLLKGEVNMRQGSRTVKTRDAIYNQTTNEFSVDNGVEYEDPALKIRGAGAHLDPIGGATFQGADFELPAIPARGSADRNQCDA
jgi:LPS-assembly protein